MRDWDWSDTMASFGLTVVVSLITFLVFIMFQDHRVRYYYLDKDGPSSKLIQLRGHRDWYADSDVDGFIDFHTAKEALDEMNQTFACGGK